MLKRISVDQLRTGMFVHEFCGSWLDHPFWRSKFSLDDERLLARVRGSGVRELVIDTERGDDLLVQPAPVAPVVPSLPDAPAAAVAEAPATPEVRTGPEYRAAAALSHTSVSAVKDLLEEVRLGRALDTPACQAVVNEVFDSVMAHPAALVSVSRLKRADQYTYQHAVALCALMVSLARQMGLPPAQVREAGLAGLLLDSGKLLVPPELLNRAGRVNDREREQLQAHVRHGHDLLKAAGGLSDEVVDAALHHHERHDGSGYPDRLPGSATGLFARMAAVCDVYDAVTSRRPYRAPWDPGEAMRHMAQSAKQFDPVIFQHFVKAVGIYPIGTLVRMGSERLAVVLRQGTGSLLTPRVKIFYSIQERHAINPFELDLSDPKAGDRIVGVESPEAWRFPHLNSLWLSGSDSGG